MTDPVSTLVTPVSTLVTATGLEPALEPAGSSRAQNRRSCSAASIEWRSLSSSTDFAVCTAVAALAAKASSSCSSSRLKRTSPVRRSKATSAPSDVPR